MAKAEMTVHLADTEAFKAMHVLLHRIAVARRGDCPDVDENWDRLPSEIEALWRDKAEVDEDANEHIAVLERNVTLLTTAIDQALHELGVPNEGYPAPVVNAVRILDDTRKNPGV